jgi:hypothetical protein
MVTGIESAIAASALARQDMQTQLSAFGGFAAQRQAA